MVTATSLRTHSLLVFSRKVIGTKITMWKMTLKQRRRHGELMAQLEGMRNNAYLWPPEDYAKGENKEEDEKYQNAQSTFQSLAQELQQLEQDTR